MECWLVNLNAGTVSLSLRIKLKHLEELWFWSLCSLSLEVFQEAPGTHLLERDPESFLRDVCCMMAGPFQSHPSTSFLAWEAAAILA